MPGFRIGKVEDKMGIRAVPVVEIHFDDCRVPASRLLGEVAGHGFKHAMMTLDKARPASPRRRWGLAQGRSNTPRSTPGTASSSARRSSRSR